MGQMTAGARRFAAGLGILALVGAGTLVGASAASAEVGPGQPGAPDGGSLTINKYAGGPLGEGESLENRVKLNNVEFTVTQVGRTDGDGGCVPIDLTVAADWDGLEGLFASQPTPPANPFCLTDLVTDGVTVDGTVEFNLDLGIYFVSETDPGDNNIVSKVPDFYVSIPSSDDEAAGGWNYSVVADPKNQLADEPSKTIVEGQSSVVVGSEVTWNLTVPVPTLNNDETFSTASVTDALDSRLSYVAQSSIVKVGDTELDEGTHYEVSGNAVWTLTDAGRLILDENMGENLTIEFQTTVTSVGNGSIPNSEYSSTFNGTTVPGETTPYSYWGKLAILKQDDSQNTLQGAEFQVFNTETDGTCPTAAPGSGTLATGTSNAAGVVQWANVTPAGELGLWIANVNNGPADPSPTRDYCVYETVIPAGHVATPIVNPVTISATEAALQLTVINPKKTGPELPLTGAQGTLALTIGGLLVIAIGIGAMAVSRRRRNSGV